MSRFGLTIAFMIVCAALGAIGGERAGYQRGFLAGEAIGSLRALPGLSLP